MFIMFWNLWKTMLQRPAEEFAAAEPAHWGEHE
jgi:hypothetical protein